MRRAAIRLLMTVAIVVPMSTSATADAVTGAMGSNPPTTSTVTSSTGYLAAQIARQLHDYPGGVQIAADTVAYRNGTVRVVFPDPSTGFVAAGSSSTSASASASASAGGSVAGAVTPAVATTSYVNGCPYDTTTRWYCFYQNANFGGTMLQFMDCSSGGTTQYFSAYGFADMTSSWVNTRISNHGSIAVWDNDSSFTNLWNEPVGTSITTSSYVGAAANDQADYFICYS
jgi:hypothetical protein